MRLHLSVRLLLVAVCLLTLSMLPTTAARGASTTTTPSTPSSPAVATTSTTPATSSTSPTTASTPSTSSSSTTTTSTAPQGTQGSSHAGVAVGILILGAGALLLAYLFFNGWRESFQALSTAALSKTGALPEYEFNPVEQALFRARGVGAEAAPALPVVKGPAAVVVGEEAKYSATLGGQAPANLQWSVDPAAAATLQPATGPTTTLVATTDGALKLSVKAPGGQPTEVPITAIPKPAQGKLPVVGIGFGGLAAAITAFTIAGALTATDNLSGTALIAFLGPVVGYFFAQSRGPSNGGGST